uniref:Uncharacterized protein n=1 Tax=Picea sitchensis TaxID=3332 RepID=C0PQ20_PICSI|nr:unknown [Picea sitchensis]
MAEKEPRHVEWARLRIAGRPLITGITTGETPLLWVACRASPRLVHVYCDSQLKVIWRFPSDPNFIHLEKERNRLSQKGCMTTSYDTNTPALFVVTLDGSVWLLPVCPADGATERPSKRKKESHTTISQTIVPSLRKDEWGLFEDIDVYDSMDCDICVTALPDKCGSSDSLMPETSCHVSSREKMSTSKAGEVCLQVKQLSTSFTTKVIQKNIPKLAMQENLIGIVQGACFAFFGPQDMVIVISTSGLELFQTSSLAGNSSAIFRRLESIDGDIYFREETTCALIVSPAKTVSVGGYGQTTVFLHDKLFGAFSDRFISAKPQHLLLKGGIDGHVYVSPLFCQEIKLSSSTVLCNLGQPILALLAIHSGNSGHKSGVLKNDISGKQPEREHLEVRDTLLIVDRDIQKSVGMVTENMPNQSAEYGIGLRRQDAVQNNASKNDLQRVRYVLKEILLPKKIPVADSLIGVTGKDFSVSNISGRPLVVLTARGRILGVEIAQYLPTPEGCYTGPIPKKTWRTWESNIDDHVKKLINIIDDISRSASYIQQCNQALNLAIAELSISLKVASSILTDPNRDRLLRPSPPNSTCVSNTRLSTRCSIKVTPFPVMLVSSRTLAFEDFPRSSEINSVENLLQTQICLPARISVTLYNCTSYSLSSHWTLVLELHNTGVTNGTTTTYSSIINNGFGLARDAQCIIEWDVKLPSLHAGPVSVFTYLCHVHDYHELLHEQSSKDQGEKMITKKHLQGLTSVDDSRIDEFLAIVSLEEIQSTPVASTMPLDPFGSIFIPLSQHRIDILSLVSQPPQKFHHTVKACHPSDTSAAFSANTVINKVCYDNVLGAFSGTLNVSSETSERHPKTAADALKIWKELLLDDVLEKGILSKAGDKVILSIPGGEIISILLKYVRDEQILLHFEAPTLLLGCLLKEALTWRLKNCKEIGSSQNRKTSLHSFPVSQDLTDRNMTDAKSLETKKQLEVILHRAEALTTIWNEIKPQDARDTKEVLPVLADIHSVINDLLKLYKSYRES